MDEDEDDEPLAKSRLNYRFLGHWNTIVAHANGYIKFTGYMQSLRSLVLVNYYSTADCLLNMADYKPASSGSAVRIAG
ncbi:hypothetical protein U1Q18_050364 [Sarracenia purpurea var. burkii]